MGWEPVGITEGVKSSNNSADKTAFGETSVAQNETQVGWGPFKSLPSQKFVQTVKNTGAIDIDGNFARVQTGTDPNGAAALRTIGYFSYNPGIGAIFRCTNIFDTPQADSDQIMGLFTYNTTTYQPENGWGFGYKGLEFGMFRFSNGTEQEFISQSQWSEDARADLIPQNGNVYQFKLQWLGFGMQFYSIEDDDGTGTFKDVHRIDYANNEVLTSVEFPSVPITMLVRNRGNTSNIALKSPSAYAASQGESFPETFTTLSGYKYPIITLAAGENYAFSIRNPLTYLGTENYSYIQPVLLSLVTDDNAPITFDVYFNMDLTGAVFADIDSDSTRAQVDTSATAWSGGKFITTFSISENDQEIIDLDAILKSKIWPGGVVTLIIDARANAAAGAGFTFRSRV